MEQQAGQVHVGNIPDVATPPVIIPPAFLLFTLIVVIMLQFAVQVWKKSHKQSYTLTTLVLMWIFPPLFIILSRELVAFHRMLILWAMFTAMTLYIGRLAIKRPLGANTPKKVYAWSLVVYKLSHMATVLGCGMLALEFFFGLFSLIDANAPRIIAYLIPPPFSMLFYGLYFGVMVRDSTEIASDRMQSSLTISREQFYQSESQQMRLCGICNLELRKDSDDDFEGGRFVRDSPITAESETKKSSTTQATKSLSCGHKFHEFCLRGWMLVGKKQECPYCKEKIEIKTEFNDINPWEADSLFYINILEIVRYITVWNPLIVIAVHGMLMLYFYYDKLVHHF